MLQACFSCFINRDLKHFGGVFLICGKRLRFMGEIKSEVTYFKIIIS